MAALFRNRPGARALLLAASLWAAPSALHAANDTLRIKPLPSKQLEHVYRNGDLDSVVIYIKMGRPKSMFLDRTDSVLAFKYLGIIYSADAQTREKGRYYFNQLLMKDPKASITELIPGENARMTFKEVREEFFELYPNLAAKPTGPSGTDAPFAARTAPDTLVVSLNPGDPDQPEAQATASARPAKKKSNTWLWVTGGLVVAGGATAAVVGILDPEPKTYKLND